jgi:N-alpha-acetyltransferase 15/16, NatA auxiliary subunit
LQLNSANTNYYLSILEANDIPIHQSPLSQEHQGNLQKILEEYQKNLPNATAHLRLMLKYLSGEVFQAKLLSYAKPLIIKGAPAMLEDLRDLYKDHEKVQIIGHMIHSMVEQMKKDMKLSADGSEAEQDPTVYLWLLYFSAQHFLFTNDFENAFKFIDEAIQHTPTVVELYILKA